jgi:hypothetical protein
LSIKPPILLNLIANILDKSCKVEKAIALYANKPDSRPGKGGRKRGRKSGNSRKSNAKYIHYNKAGHLEDSC